MARRLTESERLKVVEHVMSGKKTTEQAAQSAHVSTSTVDRWYRDNAASVYRQAVNKKYRQEGHKQ